MKKIALAIAFAVASMPLTFAAQTPANPPAKSSTSKNTTKKHHAKKGSKSQATKSGATSK